MRFLIDECLTVDLVTVAGQSGHEAQHVAHVGRAGWKDWNVVRYARDGDFVLVTNNASDFRELYATQPLHAGLVIVADGLPGTAQRLERVLTTDPGLGIVRHADAGYPLAVETAKRHGVALPMIAERPNHA